MESEKLIKPIKFLKPFDASKISIAEHPNFSEAYIIELPLDSIPDESWKETFEQKWRISKDLWDRKICLINDKIRLFTTADYFEEKLDWIERVIEDTNKTAKEYNELIEKEKEIIRDETAKQHILAETKKANMLNALMRKFA